MLLLDASIPLQLDDVREFFARRVLGQDEAVEAIVERIAMIKAGVTDPTRPLGVFLFVGPTGTGKTEIAKTLAEFLFGSSERLVRLDMSEYQTPDAFDRLLADTSIASHGAPLVASIRKDPFAVVLLDEFDKSAPPVWDLFLQVFDDGRMTDQHGRVVDFRRCVIILTSNVGSSIATRAGVGFGSTADAVPRGDRDPCARALVPARVQEPPRPDRGVPAVRARPDARAPGQGARGRPDPPRPARAALGGRARRHCVRVPRRPGLQPRARRPAAEACSGTPSSRPRLPQRSSSNARRPATSSCS